MHFFMLIKLRVKTLSRHFSLWVEKLLLVAMVTEKLLVGYSEIVRWAAFSWADSSAGVSFHKRTLCLKELERLSSTLLYV